MKWGRWQYVYFMLAAFDLLTVGASLYLSHRLMAIYSASVRTTHEWSERLGNYADVAQLAAAVNAPGNDVFDSRDASAESVRMESALTRFREKMGAARAEMSSHVPAAQAGSLLLQMDTVQGAMDEMVEEAKEVFSRFERRPASAWRG